jgi:hypothetical protein
MTVHQMPRLHRPKPLRPVTESRERRREEAADAGTPFDRLRDLSLTNPSLVLKNPAFELAVVTEPGFLLDLPEDALCALVRQPPARARRRRQARSLADRHAPKRPARGARDPRRGAACAAQCEFAVIRQRAVA